MRCVCLCVCVVGEKGWRGAGGVHCANQLNEGTQSENTNAEASERSIGSVARPLEAASLASTRSVVAQGKTCTHTRAPPLLHLFRCPALTDLDNSWKSCGVSSSASRRVLADMTKVPPPFVTAPWQHSGDALLSSFDCDSPELTGRLLARLLLPARHSLHRKRAFVCLDESLAEASRCSPFSHLKQSAPTRPPPPPPVFPWHFAPVTKTQPSACFISPGCII